LLIRLLADFPDRSEALGVQGLAHSGCEPKPVNWGVVRQLRCRHDRPAGGWIGGLSNEPLGSQSFEIIIEGRPDPLVFGHGFSRFEIPKRLPFRLR
jgi:hypothetical protein